MVCELLGRERELPAARRIALDIKQAINDDVGDTLRCSIGMAPNRYLAKIASDMQKPDGLIGLLPSQLPRAIAHLELRDLPGVGARTEVRLNSKGITTMEQLLALDRPACTRCGIPCGATVCTTGCAAQRPATTARPSPSDIQKSLGHSHVLGPEFRSDEGAWAVAHKLLHKAAMRLRMEHFYTAACRSRSSTRSRASRRRRKPQSQAAHQRHPAHRLGHGGALPRLPGHPVAARHPAQDLGKRPQASSTNAPSSSASPCASCSPKANTSPICSASPATAPSLSATMDKLNLKYGHTTLHFAGMLPARETAPTRIAFTQIPVLYGNEYM